MHSSPISPHRPHSMRRMADQVFSRSAGVPLVEGNAVTLLFNSAENFPAWEAAIREAKQSILIEIYIFSDNAFGRRLRDALIQKALSGVAVYVMYDWFGSYRAHLRGFFRPLVKAGAQVRAFNRLSVGRILQCLQRDHRKQIIIDGQVAFVSGLCISSLWEGTASQGIDSWRDTGTQIAGPIVADAVSAFADSWATAGTHLDESLTDIHPEACGSVKARLIATTPDTASMMRLDLLVASIARQTLWLTDAYFMGTGLYIHALKRAAYDGVDVRILVPRSSDISWIGTVSRTLYRPLLEAGVRVFEWNGKMMHAKTAVADFRWARIGSTNLNFSSWFSNRELDISIENEALATTLAQRFIDDLDHSTEIVLSGAPRRVHLAKVRQRDRVPLKGKSVASAKAVARQAVRIGDALGVVVKGTRSVDDGEAMSFLIIGIFLCLLAFLIGFFPRLIALSLALFVAIAGMAVMARAITLYVDRMRKRSKPLPPIDKHQ